MDYDVIIIGGGPAGLTAALYSSRARLKTLLIESLSVPGQAIITDSIENYPGFPEGINGFELMQRFKKQGENFGAEIINGDVKRIDSYKEGPSKGWKIETKDKTYSSLSVIIATGARPKKIDVPGEEGLQGKGISYCATCDGAIYKDKEVVLVGGGDAAIEEALFLTRFVKRVILIHRKSRLRATRILQERAFTNKEIEFMWGSELVEIIGKDRVSGVKVKDVKTRKEKEIPCDGVFIFVGYLPNTDFIKNLVKLDKAGYIITDDKMNTSSKGILACGDCREKILRQVITASGDGATASFSAQKYVEEKKGIAYK